MPQTFPLFVCLFLTTTNLSNATYFQRSLTRWSYKISAMWFIFTTIQFRHKFVKVNPVVTLQVTLSKAIEQSIIAQTLTQSMLYSWTAGGIRVDNGVHLPSGNLRPSSPSLKTKKYPKRKQIALDNTTKRHRKLILYLWTPSRYPT